MRSLAVAVFILLSLGHARADGTDEGLADLRQLMTERLAVMEYVAAYKWNEGLPVSDPAREVKVLKETLARAGIDGADVDEGVAAEGVTTRDVMRAIEAQMEAAKAVQYALFEAWSEADKDKSSVVPDLQISLRPKISRLSNGLISTFLAVHEDLDDCRAQEILEPVPSELADFPEAWGLAITGVLAAPDLCDGPPN